MKVLKSFESWNNNIIDNTLFSSGRAKYDPKVVGGVIKYKTGNVEPYYFAEIVKKGDKFICKVYKKKKDGTEIRIRNKIKSELKLAHNYVREFLNQKLNKKKKKKKNSDKDRIMIDKPNFRKEPMQQFDPIPEFNPRRRNKTIIRRF